MSVSVIHRGATGAFEQLPHHDAAPHLPLVHPGSLFRGRVEHQARRGIGEQRGTRGHRLQHAVLLLFPEVVSDPVVLGDKTPQAFGLMQVQMIGHNMPPRRLRLCAPWSHGDGGMCALQGLDPGPLIGGHHPFTRCTQDLGVQGQVSDIRYLLLGGRIRLGVQPLPTPVRLALGLMVKNDRHGARRWSGQSHICGPHQPAHAASKG